MALPQRPATPSATVARTRLVGPPRPRNDVLARRRILPESPACPMGLGHQVAAVDEDRPALILPFPGVNARPASAPSAPVSAAKDSRPGVPARGQETALPARWMAAGQRAAARLRRARNVALGACVAFCDAAAEVLAPVGFLWRHAQVVGLGLIYLSVPMAAALGLLVKVPSLGQAYAPNTLPGLIFLVGLYVSCAFAMVLGVVSARFVHRQARGLAAQLARQGEAAFPPR